VAGTREDPDSGRVAMAKIGPFVTIPTGAYCNITLDSGEKIVVNSSS
jgi:hypothetical protein